MSALAPTRAGSQHFDWGRRTYIMSILNITPDSFAGPAPGLDPEAALARARADIAAGADVLDVGGESTRPGATPVAAAEELRRVLPVIERLAAESPVPISIDTTKPAVARAALAAGATIVNDIHGLRADPAMARVVADTGAAVVVMANLRGVRYTDIIAAVRAHLRESLAIARAAGIAEDQVILDPGFGFGPPPAGNLEMVRRLGDLRALGRPLLLGPSRKSTIGAVLDLPVEDRLEGTAATVALGIAYGADLVRVHDTRVMARVARMSDAIVRGWPPPASPRP